MKINQTTNLRVEDYSDQGQWIGRLFTVLNAFFTEVQNILDQNVDYSTNIRSITREFDTTGLVVPINFSWPFTQAAPASLSIAKAMSGTTAIALIPAWDYNASTKTVSITALYQVVGGVLSAVTNGPRYRFTVRVTV